MDRFTRFYFSTSSLLDFDFFHLFHFFHFAPGSQVALFEPGGRMATASLTNVDIRVRDAVMHQLEWDPEVDASEPVTPVGTA